MQEVQDGLEQPEHAASHLHDPAVQVHLEHALGTAEDKKLIFRDETIAIQVENTEDLCK